MNEKYGKSGAKENTPSKSEYFSWINNTNEGSTEAQTLVNFAYFDYLKRTYGMQLDIYAWDAGNLDGARETYETFDSPKIKAQYPNGYGPIAKAAEKLNTRLGVWGGPDGFGKTKESAEKRLEQMVSLARDYRFALFKFDGVCGQLAPENRPYFVKMMQECRRYQPDFILLNHRLDFGEEGMQYATTFLWEGVETYVDVHIANDRCAPHHRAYMMSRGNTPNMTRMTEDHGVCISSQNEYFEDELIIQAFGRNLILAPEIYGNPWLLRDFEQAHLARIFNLHRRWNDILVDGFELTGDTYPNHTVVRGSTDRRFIATGNMTWNEKTMQVPLDEEIGLAKCEKVAVFVHHPYEKFIGFFDYGETVGITIEPFRASLVQICDADKADKVPLNCEYEVLHENENGLPDKVKIVSCQGDITLPDGTKYAADAFDNTLRVPVLLATLPADSLCEVPANSDRQLETLLFAQNHDSLERQAVNKAGLTAIPEVQAARDAFFGQKTYRLRGIESRYAFDGKDETFFDGTSKLHYGGYRIEGGCLRVDFGSVYDADCVEITYFDSDEQFVFRNSIQMQGPTGVCSYSADLAEWNKTSVDSVYVLRSETAPVLVQDVHNVIEVKGKRKCVRYPLNRQIRYFRMPCPLDRIYKIALMKDGNEIKLQSPKANNLLPTGRKVEYAKELQIKVPASDWKDGCYISVALDGKHGIEGAYALLETNGAIHTAPDRAPSYQANGWECPPFRSVHQDHHYTYYFPIAKEMCDKDLTVRILGMDKEKSDYPVQVYLCDENRELDGIVLSL
ncbi:MAG: hypothetical protein IKJ63_11910 [Clostridia bacterium]|nr:hypothetical protein [Clostridia bacterium]